MDIRQLKYFIAVAECLSFTEASKQLYVAQSAVSQQIRDLEEKIGVLLFFRNKRTVKLTNAGKVLYSEAVTFIVKFDELIEKTKQAEKGLYGTLKIGVIGYADRNYLPQLIKKFRVKYPTTHIQLNQYNHGALIEALKTEDLDIGITFSFGVDAISSLEKRKVFTEAIVVVLPSDHPMADRESIDLAELAEEKFIVQSRLESPQGFNKTLQICSSSGFTPNIVSEPNLIQTVLLLVDSGMGIAILPKSLESHASPTLKFLEIKGDESLLNDEIVAAWKSQNHNPTIRLFLEIMEEAEGE